MQVSRSRLRTATGAAHRRVDDMFGALNSDRAGDYTRFLTAHLTALRAVVSHVDTRVCVDCDCLCALITADLVHLGSAVAPLPITPQPFRGDPLGVLYVLAGSHFGNRVLLRQWRDVSTGAQRYLSSGHLKTAWSTVICDLEQARPEQTTDAIAAALWTFDVFERAACAVLAGAQQAA